MKFEIQGRLPGLNELILAAKQGKGKYQPYAALKRQYTEIVTYLAKKLPCFNRVDVTITWHEPNSRRDIDNVAAGGTKIILDSLVKAGTIQDDSQRYINSITHKFEIDRENPRIEVEVREAKI